MKKLCLIIIMMMLLMAAVSQAATVTFTQKGWGAGDIVTSGQIMAVNLGIGQNATVDGVTFVGVDKGLYTENGVTASFFSGVPMANGGDQWNSQNTANYDGTTWPTGTDAQALLDNLSGAYNPKGGDGSVDFRGLTIGKTYELQLIYVDDMDQNTGRVMKIWSGDSPTGDPDIVGDHSSRADDRALLVTGTFTADATTQSLWMDFYGVPTDGDNGWLNAMQLRMLPPSQVAGTPSPLNKQTMVPVGTQLSWTAPEAYIPSGYDVWIGTDPNILSGSYDMEKIVSAQNVLTADPAAHSSLADDMDYGTTYYWRVDAYDPNDGNPVMYLGVLWSFTTEPPYPVLTGQPDDQLVFANQSAVFTVAAYDPQGTTLSYQWYKYVDGISDTPVGTNSATLTLSPTLTSADEGDYYCVVTNEALQSMSSNTANLLLKKLVGWWKFDGDPNDASGIGNDGVVYNNPGYVPGVNGVGQAIFFDRSDGINNGCYIPEALFDSIGPDEVTISLWAYGGDLQPINNTIFSALTPVTFVRIFYVNLSSVDSLWQEPYVFWAAGNHAATYDRINKFVTNPNDYKGQWNHWVFTKNAATGEMKIYLNGVLWHQGTGKTQQSELVARLYIGNGQYDAPYNDGKYDGAIDDFRIYNYELATEQIADLYLETSTDTQVCMNRPEFDISGPAGEPDCAVDLCDFAAIAASWLEVGLYPANP